MEKEELDAYTRTVSKAGGGKSGRTMAIPLDWIRLHNIEPGDKVSVLIVGDHLEIYPESHGKEKFRRKISQRREDRRETASFATAILHKLFTTPISSRLRLLGQGEEVKIFLLCLRFIVLLVLLLS